MLTVQQVTAIRDDRVLFAQLSFEAKSGDLIQIEGRNGTGKTTLLRIIAGLGDKEEGDILWQGTDVERDRDTFHQNLLFLGHQTGVKKDLSGLENLQFYQSVFGLSHNRQTLFDALAQVGLAGREDIPVSQLSAGQQRRVALARLWLTNQKLWILDEPLTAIDKQGVKVLESLFLSHANQGGIVLLTTHQDMFIDNPKLRKITLG
ncbi:cytochrome c biogenesis heme-transporting ATPase CcmA [Vibrio ulleungensis]|uniref:Cytochrome c biogenesis heme-transporting ATPase CcmA n=1 Tax=Vibrio ulleungensis TaxID=2807619 RepID=A0ABS2HFG1_9VIBR|nr:cytochrome c biogenesis heme-transporting ATPase CcmA [Vibrio ulleungensis]MBM7036305.1 cytochrome c biogenesis heme-transporting ATPase CcmA [Vibrio ulleungensis]